jgi:bifunctional DNA-binding transcriptional regulator/antitoxin component of YhaV-PrlF toxin-antitoxin module
MTSTVTSNGETVVPQELRERLKITAGTTLDWREESGELRVVKMESVRPGSFIDALRRFGAVPAAPRDRRPVNLDL